MVELNAFESAVFIADMAFSEHYRKSSKKHPMSLYGINHIRSNRRGEEQNPLSRMIIKKEDPEKIRVAKWEYNKERREFIIQFLKDRGRSEYAERFASYDKSNLPLMYPTEESLSCEHLTKDKRHCKLKRPETGCYTCCFVCHTPRLCAFTTCPLLPNDRIPSKEDFYGR